jgi:hypothetical protein
MDRGRGVTSCTRSSHEQLKSDPEVWRHLAYLGIQRSGDGEVALELRNCHCGSTLSVEVATKEHQR